MKYICYGITLESPFHCPELPASELDADVVVKWGRIGAASYDWLNEGACYKAAPSKYLLSVPGLADYLVEDGRSVTIERAPDGDEDWLRLHFYNEVMGALLWQRGNLLLKGCVLERDGKGIAFVGPSPSGKTMTAARLSQQGYRVVADGFFSVAGNDASRVMPGYPRLMLWERSLERLNMPAKDLKPVRKGMLRYYWPLEQSFCNEPVKLETVYVHSFCGEPGLSVAKAVGAKKLLTLVDNRYHPELPTPLGVAGATARIAATLAKQTEVKILRYNDTLLSFDAYIEHLGRELIHDWGSPP